MKKIITLFMLMFIVSISFAQYTPMTAAGYQFKRILCDSTLHIPSFCGIPTLRNSTAKNGAIAMDTCNYKIYMWTNAGGWGEIIGAGTDTTSLSLRIDQRVKYTDTAQMLLAYLRKQDTANRFVANVTKVNDSTIRVFKGNTITDLKILGKGTDTTSLSNRIDLRVKYTDTAAMLLPYLRKVDTTAMLSKYLRKTDTASLSNRINLKVNISDTATMLSNYLRKTDTTNRFVNAVTKVNDSTIRVFKGTTSTDIELPRGSGGGGGTGTVYNVSTGYALSGGPINTTGTIIVDSSVLSTKYLRRADTSNLVATKSNLALKLNISDTSSMLSKYLRKVDTLSLSNRINLKLNIADTSNKWVNAVTKKNDSTITVFKGATATDITLPRGSSGSTGTVTNVATGYGLSGGPITSTGTIIVDSATLSTKYLRRADTSNLVATKSNLALKLNIVDTTNKFVNNVTKINDTAIRVWKGTTSTVISLAKDIVYTQSPIMSKISNDSNIIYFNADTADVWRGGGSGTTPTLQEVTTTGATSTDEIILSDYGLSNFHTNLNKFIIGTGNQYYPLKYNDDAYGSTGHIKSYDDSGNPWPEIQFLTNATGTQEGFTLNNTGLTFNYNNNYNIKCKTNDVNYSNYDVQLPIQINSVTSDTLATLRDLRGGGGGGSTGTVTNVATGYGLSGGPITSTGTIIVDTASLSNKYLRIVDTTNQWINGSGTATRVSYWSANRTLRSSPNMIWNTSDSSLGVSNFYTGTAGSTQFDINSTATSLPASLGIWRRQINGAYTYLKEDEQGNAQHKWAFVRRDGFNQTRAFYQANSSIMNINLGWESPNSSNYDGSTLLINPKINISNALHSGTIIRGIYYNPTLTSLTNTKHIAFQSTSGDIVLNNLKTSSSTTDSIAIFVNDTLKKAPYPSGGGGLFVPYTGATADVDLGIRILSAQELKVTGTNGTGDLHLRHQATDATATGQSTSLFADANGDLKYKNAGNFYTTLKTSSNAANAIYTFPSATTTLIGAADTASMLTPYLRKIDTASLSNRINLKLNISDTSVFQKKSISLYSFMANNTNATGNATAQTFRDTAGTYAGTITWTGTAPTTQTINAYQWQQTGKMVRLQLFGYYTNAGVVATAVSLTIPADCPAPDISMFTSGALAVFYQGIGGLGLSNTSLTTTTNAYMRRNAANNGNELLITAAGANYRRYQIDITYRAQ